MALMRKDYHYNKGTTFLFSKAIQMTMVLLLLKMSAIIQVGIRPGA
jgi:hypothetical protein